MSTALQVEGPFEIEYETNGKGKRVLRSNGKAFWEQPGVSHLIAKQGCYVFATRASKGFTPWYVGKASKGFRQETFTDHKLKHYNTPLFRGGKGTPVFFFVTPPGNSRKVKSADLDHMEKELIQFAALKNPLLCNVQHARSLPEWSIKGVIRPGKGKPTAAAKQFKLMLKIK